MQATTRNLLRRIPASALFASIAACGASTGAVQAPAPTPAPAAEAQPEVGPVLTAEESPLFAGLVDLDTVHARPFDTGKMWTFEYPPLAYFQETYGFQPDSIWFRHARLGALRLPNCSASFVSPHGLILTNHHCAEESLAEVNQPGEALLDSGFYARKLTDERRVEGLDVDQVIDILDVTDELQAALEGITGDAERAQAVQNASDEISSRLSASYGAQGVQIEVEVIPLWNGARYSAYVFRVYDDVRLVMAPELKVGQFGGDPDNFTYPRYNLDMSFFRVYDEEGNPVESADYFRWDATGADSGEVVFIVGNPAETSRLQTVAQLEFRRKAEDRFILHFYTSRAEVLQSFMDAEPQLAEERGVRTDIFSLLNSKKAYEGIVRGLFDPVLMARKRDAERQFRAAIEADSALDAEFGGLFQRMADIQDRKLELAPEHGAFLAIASPDYTSSLLFRAIFAYQYSRARGGGAPANVLNQIKGAILGVAQQPIPLQQELLAARLEDFRRNFGDSSSVVQSILHGRTPARAAEELLAGSVLADSTATAQVLATDSLDSNDPAIQLVGAFLNRYFSYSQAWQELTQQEAAVASALGRARFHVYGTSIPPDATFSLRIADGVVKGYSYNGTYAPVRTTFYGVYDRFYSYAADSEWDLPQRWLKPPRGFDLSTPLDFISTADIIGGNSGSPVLDRELRVVGVVFDGNIESLPGEFIYDPESNRAIAVDARGILAALQYAYGAERLVSELTSGEMR